MPIHLPGGTGRPIGTVVTQDGPKLTPIAHRELGINCSPTNPIHVAALKTLGIRQVRSTLYWTNWPDGSPGEIVAAAAANAPRSPHAHSHAAGAVQRRSRGRHGPARGIGGRARGGMARSIVAGHERDGRLRRIQRRLVRSVECGGDSTPARRVVRRGVGGVRHGDSRGRSDGESHRRRHCAGSGGLRAAESSRRVLGRRSTR